MSSTLLGEDIIILADLFVDLVFSPVSACSFPPRVSVFVVSIDEMSGAFSRPFSSSSLKIKLGGVFFSSSR